MHTKMTHGTRYPGQTTAIPKQWFHAEVSRQAAFPLPVPFRKHRLDATALAHLMRGLHFNPGRAIQPLGLAGHKAPFPCQAVNSILSVLTPYKNSTKIISTFCTQSSLFACLRAGKARFSFNQWMEPRRVQ